MDLKELVTGKQGISLFTGSLRWRNGVLEQERAYQDYEDGTLVGARTEWEAVPTVDDAKS